MGKGLETEERLRELQGARKAHATLHGNLLRSAAEKKTLQRFEWARRPAEIRNRSMPPEEPTGK